MFRHPVVLVELVEPGDAVEVDERARRGEAQLHQGDEALASGQDLRLVPVALEDRKRLVQARRGEVLETGRVHPVPPSPPTGGGPDAET